MNELERITINPNQCGGRPCVRGMRIRNQPIANSGYYLLTHGETWQKTADIAAICRVIGLPTGTVKVEEIEKSDLFKGFVV